MWDFSGLLTLLVIIMLISLFVLPTIIYLIYVKHKVLKLTYKMNEYQVSKYFQKESGFPYICRWLHLLEFPIVIILSTFHIQLNYYICLNCLICILLIISNCIMRYKANKSKPITWWFKGVNNNEE